MADLQHFSGIVTPVASTTGKCGLVVTPGVEPTTPEPGGLWYDSGLDCMAYFAPDGTTTYLPKGMGNAGEFLLSNGDAVPTWQSLASLAENYSGAGSHQPLAADLTLAAGAGKDVATGTAYLAPMMGNLWGDALTKTGNYLGGLIGAYSVTGALASHYPSGAVLAQITDGVTAVKGAVVAYIDGDSAQTNAEAAFKVMCNNSTAASGFDYGVDLYDASHDGFAAVSYKKAPIRLSAKFCILDNAGVPDASIGATFADKGSLCSDTTNGNLYINTGDATTPVWKVVPFTP